MSTTESEIPWCIYQINDLTLNTQLGTLTRDEQEIPLPQLSYRLLYELVQSAPAILSQDELMTRVWGDQVVSDETLKQRIKLLRQAIADTPQHPIYIASVRGRGYRCIATITEQAITAPVQQKKTIHDSINLTLGDRLPVAFMQGSADYWRMVAIFFLLIITVLITIVSINYAKLISQPVTTAKNSALSDGPSAQAKSAYQKGRLFYQRYRSLDNEMAIKSYLRATELAPDYALAFAGLADAYSQGVFQFSGDDSWQKKALEAAYDAIMLNDQLADSYKSLGTAHYVNGHLSQALAANLKALELNPDYLEAQANLGYIYSERGQLRNALERHQQAYQSNPQYSVNWYHIALSSQRLGHLKSAVNWYQKVLTAKPDYHLATFHYSRLLLQQNKLAQAESMLHQAEKQSPDSLNILKGLINIYLLSQQVTKAKPWIHKLQLLSNGEHRQYAELLTLLTSEPTDRISLQSWYDKHTNDYNERPFSHIQLAMAAAKLNTPDTAFRHLTQAVELGWLDEHYLNHQIYFAKLKSDNKFQRIVKLLARKKRHENTLVQGLQLNWQP